MRFYVILFLFITMDTCIRGFEMKRASKERLFFRPKKRNHYGALVEGHGSWQSSATKHESQTWNKKRHWIFIVAIPVFILFVVSVVIALNYGFNYILSRTGSRELQSAFHEPVPTDQLLEETVPAETSIPEPKQEASLLISETASGSQVQTPQPLSKAVLDAGTYTTNPNLRIDVRFRKLQESNRDIIGWLNISGTLDEAVVQRNNTYYLKRDYKGYHNNNGALFLDENCNLKSRPYTFLIYGHNMKTGAMFGCLHKYDSLTYYKSNPWITFDTLYETGKYIVFSAGSMSTEKGRKNYLDFSLLNSSTISYREKGLDTIQKLSVFSGYLDVQPDDQLLILVTCSGDDTERRFVAARRVREGEDESKLLYDVNRAWKKW